MSAEYDSTKTGGDRDAPQCPQCPQCPQWWVYIIECDDRLYTGITTDPERRLHEHQSGRGARFTRGAQRVTMRYRCALGSRSIALRAEYRLKNLPRGDKLALIRAQPMRDALLARLALSEHGVHGEHGELAEN